MSLYELATDRRTASRFAGAYIYIDAYIYIYICICIYILMCLYLDVYCCPDQVSALLDEILATNCVDASRVFATGVSNGGMFLYELATDSRTASRFAGAIRITIYMDRYLYCSYV